jgi:anti-anti-sigma regulatory factor
MITRSKLAHRMHEGVVMPSRSRTVVVEQLPEILSMRQGRLFLREIKNCMCSDRPQIVLDCSHVRQVNSSLIHALLCCLEEAIKRSGDVKLAALLPAAKATLQSAGVDRVFEIYDTTNDAVISFRQPADVLHGNVGSAA